MTTSKEFDLIVFIGRFQPFHRGHAAVVKHALQQAEKVLILVGSSNRARDTRNPFTYDERCNLIFDTLNDSVSGVETSGRVSIMPLPDHPYDRTRWIETVQHKVAAAHGVLRPRIALTGHRRDASSEYLSWFPQWPFSPAADSGIEATHIRKAYFQGGAMLEPAKWVEDMPFTWNDALAAPALDFLHLFRGSDCYATLMSEYAKEMAYKRTWGDRPFLTADAIIVQSGHIATVRRKPDALGGGMLALPGGFKNTGETLIETSRREAVEETYLFCLDHAERHTTLEHRQERARARLAQHYVAQRTFDDPHRSRRGDITTQGVLYKLPDGPLEPLLGADDVDWAGWTPISEISGLTFFEDHAFIADKLLQLLP